MRKDYINQYCLLTTFFNQFKVKQTNKKELKRKCAYLPKTIESNPTLLSNSA